MVLTLYRLLSTIYSFPARALKVGIVESLLLPISISSSCILCLDRLLRVWTDFSFLSNRFPMFGSISTFFSDRFSKHEPPSHDRHIDWSSPTGQNQKFRTLVLPTTRSRHFREPLPLLSCQLSTTTTTTTSTRLLP